VSAFAAVLVLLGMVLLVAAAIYAAARLLGVARSPLPVLPFTGGLPPAEHAFSRLGGREPVAEGDGECVDGGLPAHGPPGAAGPGRIQGPGDQVEAL
jgi:hypothetical protein